MILIGAAGVRLLRGQERSDARPLGIAQFIASWLRRHASRLATCLPVCRYALGTLLDPGVIWLLLSAAGFGAMAIFAKEAYAAGVNLPTLLAVRFGLAAA